MKSLIIWGEEGDENSHINEIIAGRKKAFCTPEAWFGTVDGEPETEQGDQMILKDPSGKERVLAEITEVRHLTFGQADEKLAADVLDCDLQDFRDAHRFYWGDEIEVTDDLPIVAEYFRIVKVL
ncbi:MAG: ASCH domain-containing protein [Spirochaetales bacterium]|nr:ASCH domain-containing protein [Spirochaetales bacterium]